ncbi:broad specificity phosphatase PhoE [Yoonia maricola]|uniref:Broad specificity phosphatase PhoE n=1 Tax=Yoonia maricola TaxID=420999 RepID=A0A2M8W301_9RHOB|nr:histidine phosphatase family protein [Yoonia maricola]PJI85303.1 broad specificity phosphatase PhoE [Yoonia maricola]
MTKLWLVRHGPTHAKSMVGWSDIPADLSDTAAISRLRDFLPDAPVVSSDLIRAAGTADALNPKIRLPHDPNLREINFGDWELRTFSEVEAEDPDRIRAYWETPGHVAPPNGESWNAVRQRVDRAIERHLTNNDKDLIIVAHFGVILTQVQRALGIGAYEAFSHRIDNLSVTLLDTDGWTVEHINHNP